MCPIEADVPPCHLPTVASIAKESDSGAAMQMVFSNGRNHDQEETKTMSQKTCAACDCELDQNSIKVKLGGKTVEVCCEECAAAIGEAETARTAAASAGK
ncbi:hypothetical protein ASD00_08665 [Ensifer sp. Root31]|nr:hypothetical protein ASD00_08665 [Ensifer sp. Root31]